MSDPPSKPATTEIKLRLGDLLVRSNLLDEIQLRVALKEQRETGERLGTTLVKLGFIEEAVLAAFLSKQTDAPCINISNIHIPDQLLQLIPMDFALRRSVVPIRQSGGKLYLAMADPTDAETIRDAQTVSGLTVVPLIAPEISLRRCLVRHYEPERAEHEDGGAALRGLADEIEDDRMRALTAKVDALGQRIEDIWAALEELRDFMIPKG